MSERHSVIALPCVRWSAMRLPPRLIALILLLACGAEEHRRTLPHRSRAARLEHESSAAYVEASTAAMPPPCSLGVKATSPSDTTAATADWTDQTFFDRVRSQLTLHWSPAMHLAQIDPTRKHYGTRTRTAAIRVCLSRTGELTGATITSASGVPELDEAMVRAFQSAAPFLNPPETLVYSDDQIRFAYSFEFYPTPAGKGPVMSLYPSRQPPHDDH